MKKIYYMMIMAMMSVAMVSCDDWDWDSPYYVDDIVGSWESYYGCDGYYEYDILGYDVVRYDFYANHTGRYTYYSSYYGLDYVDFDWDTYGNRLQIRYYDGDYEYLYYGYDRAGYLVLSLDSQFYRYTVYRPSGMYWKQFTDQAEANGLSVKKEMKVDMSKTSFKTQKVEERK